MLFMSSLVTSSGFPLMKLYKWNCEVWLVVKTEQIEVHVSILLSMNLSSTHTCSSFTVLLEYQHFIFMLYRFTILSVLLSSV